MDCNTGVLKVGTNHEFLFTILILNSITRHKKTCTRLHADEFLAEVRFIQEMKNRLIFIA